MINQGSYDPSTNFSGEGSKRGYVKNSTFDRPVGLEESMEQVRRVLNV